MMRRVMCVWCPLWPIQRLRAIQPELHDRPVILFAESRRSLRVTTCSLEAIQSGIHVGMPLGEAKSLLPNKPSRRLQTLGAKPFFQEADPVAARTHLRDIVLHCQRYSPLVGLEEVPEPESFWMDISGSESLFGGEQGLIETLCADLAKQGIQVHIAIADTLGAAWGICHFAESAISIVPSGMETAALAPLSVRSAADSRLGSGIAVFAGYFGDRSADDVAAYQLAVTIWKRACAKAGSGAGACSGSANRGTAGRTPSRRMVVRGTSHRPPVSRTCLQGLAGTSTGHSGDSTRRIAGTDLPLDRHDDGTDVTATFASHDGPSPLDGTVEVAVRTVSFHVGRDGAADGRCRDGFPPIRQILLFDDDGEERRERSLEELVDRLRSRLGDQAVLRSCLQSDPLPEFSFQCVPWPEVPTADKTANVAASRLRCRPLRLLKTPQPLNIEQDSHQELPSRVNRSSVARVSGPERIESGWWRGPDMKRDYYRLDLVSGACLWAFCDRNSGRWFLHGLFS